MRINDKFKIEFINNHNVIINCETEEICGAINFNEIKMFLWQLAKDKNVTKAEMLDAALNEFEISTVLALGEIDNFIRKLKELGIIS